MARPRTHDREKIMIDMLEWAMKDTSLNVNQFCAWFCNPPIGPQKLSEWSKEDDWFRESYDAVKAFVAYRRECALKTGELHVKAYDLCAPAYDYIIREMQHAFESFKSKLKQEEQSPVKEEDKHRFDAIMNQLSSLQSSSIQASTKCNTETKS